VFQVLKRKLFKVAGPNILFCEEMPAGEDNIRIHM